jgi:ubiquitin carboxyl-terminal hydrolase 10
MDSFMPIYVHDTLKEKKRFDLMCGGHQEDAEEFPGFYLDTLEEELLMLPLSLTNPNPAPAQQNNNAAANNTPEDGRLEVGKRNRTVITRSTAESPLTCIFSGKFRSTLRVPHQKDSVVVKDWHNLRLDVVSLFLLSSLLTKLILSQRDTIHTITDALCTSPPPIRPSHFSNPPWRHPRRDSTSTYRLTPSNPHPSSQAVSV